MPIRSRPPRLIALGLAILATGAGAEPFLAVQNGFKCSQCHVNRTGGGMRNDFGSAFTQYLLPAGVKPADMPFDRKLGPSVTTGGNLRVESFSNLPYRNDSVRAGANSQIRIPEGNAYVQIDLIRNFLKVYADQAIAPAPESREAFALIETGRANAYMKAGKFLQPFGLRLYDDDTPTRNITQFTYANPRTGIEAGMEPGPFSLSWSVAENQTSGVASLNYSGWNFPSTFRVGASAYRGYADLTGIHRPLSRADRGMGAFLGGSYRKVSLFGEVDRVTKREGDRFVDKAFGFVEADWFIRKGLSVKGVVDWTHPDLAVPFARNGRSRWVAGLEYFPIQFLQLGLFYHLRSSIPQDGPRNQDQARFQLHAFY